MAIEKVILSMQEQLLDLNDRVEKLSKKVNELEKKQQTNNTEKSTNNSSTRKTKIKGKLSKDVLIEYLKNILKDEIPSNNIRKGTQKEKASVLISKGDKKIRILLRSSGYYGEADTSNRMRFTGFTTLPEKLIIDGDGHISDDNVHMSYDFYIFAVSLTKDSSKPLVEFFVFNQQQFKDFLLQKSYSGRDDNRIYYFYLGQTQQGKYIDDRERDKELSVDEEHNNWNNVIEMYRKL